MSSSECLPNLPSPEFVTLCQAQSRLVQQGFQVDWCGVYLTRSRSVPTTSPSEVEDPELIPRFIDFFVEQRDVLCLLQKLIIINKTPF